MSLAKSILASLTLVGLLWCGWNLAGAQQPATQPTVRPTTDPAPRDAAQRDAADALLAEMDSLFTAGGRPVHPKLLREFCGWISDGDTVTLKVDVTTALQAENEYYFERVKVSDDPSDPIRWNEEDGSGYSYWYLGKAGEHLHAYVGRYDTGGTFSYVEVGFVKLAIEPINGQRHVTMSTRGLSHLANFRNTKLTVEPGKVVAKAIAEARPNEPQAKDEEFVPW